MKHFSVSISVFGWRKNLVSSLSKYVVSFFLLFTSVFFSYSILHVILSLLTCSFSLSLFSFSFSFSYLYSAFFLSRFSFFGKKKEKKRKETFGCYCLYLLVYQVLASKAQSRRVAFFSIYIFFGQHGGGKVSRMFTLRLRLRYGTVTLRLRYVYGLSMWKWEMGDSCIDLFPPLFLCTFFFLIFLIFYSFFFSFPSHSMQ